MKIRLLTKLLAVALFGLVSLPVIAGDASVDKRLTGHWISFADSSKGTHEPKDIIMLTFTRGGAFVWQDQTHAISGTYTADRGKFALVDVVTGESIVYAYRFYDGNLITEAADRLTTTFLKTKQGGAELDAMLAKVTKAKPAPAPGEPAAPAKVAKAKPAPRPPQPGNTEAACQKNLDRIYAAIQAYRKDHKDTPDWLSNLVPKYLPESALACPSGRTPGELLFGLDDPNRPTSYVYEFSNRVVPSALARGASITMKQWRRDTMSLVGGGTPIVRCHLHDHVLNLSFDGEIYESGEDWARLPRFKDVVDPKDLAPKR